MSPTATAPPEPADGAAANRRRRLVVIVVGVLVVALVVAAAGWWFLGRGPRGPLADAVRTMPADSLRVGYTDWSTVARELDAPDREDALDATAVADFLARAYDGDVTTTSALVDSFAGLAANLGVTPADAVWEAYGQTREGSVDVLRLDPDVDMDRLADRMEESGWERPDDPEGVWLGSVDLVATFEQPLTPLQVNLALVPDRHLLLMSEDADFLADAVPVATGSADSVMQVDGVAPLVDAVAGADSAQLWVSDFVCEDLAMSQADPLDVEEADRLVEEVGGVHPLSGMVLGRWLGSQVRLGMWFDSEEQAADDLQPRTDLARGLAPGQGGSFADRFEVTDSRQDGALVRMELRATEAALMTDIDQGPVLFATC